MRLPPLLAEHPRPVQILLAMVVPALYGAATGYALGISGATYLILSIIGVLGGIAAGFDHLGARAGARRGVLAGSIFGASILIAHAVHGASAKVDLPHPGIFLVLITTGLAAAFGALGGWLRARAACQQAATGGPASPAL